MSLLLMHMLYHMYRIVGGRSVPESRAARHRVRYTLALRVLGGQLEVRYKSRILQQSECTIVREYF